MKDDFSNERWTSGACNAIELAEEAGNSLGHPYIGTEHLLLGLLAVKESTAGRALEEAGVKAEPLLELIRKLVTPEEGDGTPADTEAKEASDAADIVCAQAILSDPEPGFTPRLLAVLEEAQTDAASRLQSRVGTGHLLLALLRDTESLATRLLHTMEVSLPGLYSSVLEAMGLDKRLVQTELSSARSGEESSATPTLDEFSRDLTAMARDGKMDPVTGREREIARVIQILSRRTKNNPCLVGEPGVGKTAIVEGLAQQIVQERTPEGMPSRRLVALDLSGMVAGTKYRGEFEQRIRNVIDEVAQHPGILLFIDELHTIIGAGGAEGSLDAANILKPALSRGEIQVIGATTLEEYRKYIEKDAALERRFQPVTVDEPSVEETIDILKELRPYYEKHHRVSITEEALKAAAELSTRYITDRRLPDKAIDVMDEAASKIHLGESFRIDPGKDARIQEEEELNLRLEQALSKGDMEQARQCHKELESLRLSMYHGVKRAGDRRKAGRKDVVDEQAVAGVISDWTRIPVQKLTESETKRLARLEKELHRRVIGQEEAVRAVAQAVKRGRVGLKDPRRPVGSFLLLGPTGVGKTELSKALAEAVFGSEQNMIRVDMSEFMEKHSVSRLIGSPPGYVGFEDGGQLSEKVRRNPYSVVLFDEIEKAHPDVFNILLQVLDDGHITDSHGRRVDFRQTIIIMTSNAGAQAIVEPKQLGFMSGQDEKRDYERMKSGVMEEIRRIFRPEFLNRIDEIMVFHMLSKEEIRKIVDLLLKDLTSRCHTQMGIELKISPAVKDEIAKAGFDPKFGARPLRRQIQTRLEDELANELLEGRIRSGQTVRVRLKGTQILFAADADAKQEV